MAALTCLLMSVSSPPGQALQRRRGEPRAEEPVHLLPDLPFPVRPPRAARPDASAALLGALVQGEAKSPRQGLALWPRETAPRPDHFLSPEACGC